MYYLRADQAHQVEPTHGSVDPVKDRGEIRFRFPFPDEDGCEPSGAKFHEDFERGVRIPGNWQLPPECDGHGSVQFVARPPGYVLSIPCPEGPEALPDLHVGKNGWSGDPVVRAQHFIDGQYWTVVACGACGAMWRLTPEQAVAVADAFDAEAERQEYANHGDDGPSWGPAHSDPSFYLKMAARIRAGYEVREEATV